MAAKSTDDVRPVPALDIGHDRVQRYLDSVRRAGVPSLLFTGPEGCGKEYTAIDFARRLCCRESEACTPAPPGAGGVGESGVGESGGQGGPAAHLCPSCARAVLLEHPGIHIVYPTPTQGAGEGEDGDVTDIARVLDDKRRDIFSVYRFSKKASIRIARARAVIQRANTRPFDSPYNVFVFVDAHAMREEAQNALLKLVEEPPPHCVLIFVTSNPESILYTIRSRCQHVRFTPLKTAAIERVLRDYYGVDPAAAGRAARLAQGNLQRARALIQSEDDGQGAVAAIVAGLADAEESWVIGRALDVGRSGNRDAVARFLHELSVAFRDVMVEDPALMINSEHTDALVSAAASWPRRRLPAVIDRIARARHEILVRNMNVDGALVSLFLELRRAAA